MNKAKKIIQAKGITEGQLLDATGFSGPTIQQIMTSDNWPNKKTYAETIAKVAKVLGVSMDELYADNGNGPKK